MNEAIIDNWNSVVAPEDTVYHLGDVCLGPVAEWHDSLSRLNGYKVLIVGNHERIFKGEKPKMQEKFATFYDDYFDEVHDNLRGIWLDDGTIVDLSHFPYDGDSHDGDRYTDYRLHDGGRVLIHGHVHREYHGNDTLERYDTAISRSKRGSIQIHVGMDNHHYRPVSEDEVIAMIDRAKSNR